VHFFPRVASGAEVRPLHGAEAEAMFVVMTRRAQTTAKLARGRITHEAPRPRRPGGKALQAECPPRGPIVVSRSQIAPGEVLPGQSFLVLRLVAAAALAVPDGLREVRMAARRVALPTADPLDRVETLSVVRAYWDRMAVLALLDVRGGPGNGPLRI